MEAISNLWNLENLSPSIRQKFELAKEELKDQAGFIKSTEAEGSDEWDAASSDQD